MNPKRIIVLFTGLVLTLFLSTAIYSTVHAKGETWYWNGNSALQANGGYFGSGIELTSSNNDDSTKPRFKPSDGDLSHMKKTYACIGDKDNRAYEDITSDGKCKNAAPGDALQRCTNSKQGDCAKVFIVECSVTALEVQVDEGNNSLHANRILSTAKIIKDNVHGNVSSSASGHFGCAEIDFGQIHGGQGSHAADTSLNEGLAKEKARLSEQYVKKICGNSPTPQCAEDARNAFDTIWGTCISNTDNIAVSDNASAETKIKSISSCIQQSTGMEVDINGLKSGLLSIPDYETEKPSCTIEWIGWIVCPVTRFMGKLADAGFNALETLLQIKPLNRGTEGGDSLFNAWALMRNVANALFVIAFMIIIYSQLTGVGLDNYGIKKLLPRIIIAALLVNASYYIAVIMVDLSNIVGSSLYHILKDYAGTLTNGLKFEQNGWAKVIETVIGVTAAGTAIAGAAIFGSLSALVPLLTTVILSLFTAIMILVGRYAFIIILIIVAPIAFVAYLLPNTQKWFNLWYKTFLGLLMLYPIMGLIYGGSYLAGIIVMNSAGSRTGVQADLLQLFGMAITAIPLLLTPIIMKFSGGVLNRFGGRVRNNSLFKKANERASGYAERKKNARDFTALQRYGDKSRSGLAGVRDKAIQRRFKKEAIRGVRAGQLSKATSTHISAYMSGEEGSGGDKASLFERAKAGIKNRNNDATDTPVTPKTKGEKYTEGLAKGGDSNALNRALSQAVNAKLSVHNEEVATAKEMLTKNFSEDDWKRIATGMDATHTSTAVRQAAIEKIAELQDNSIDDIVKVAGTMDGQLRYALARSVQKNNNSPLYSNPTAVKAIMNGGVYQQNGHLQQLDASTFHQQIVAPSVTEGTLSSADLASAEHETIADINTAIEQGHITGDAAQNVSKQAGHALDNRYAKERTTEKTHEQLQKLANRGPQPPTGGSR